MARSALQLVVFAAACALLFSTGSCDEYDVLVKQIEDFGGKVQTKIGVDKNGIRGLYAKVDIPKGEAIATIPASLILNAGSISGSFLTPSLTLLRELRHPDSRFKPYIDTFPKQGSVINACTLKEKYWPLLEAQYWVNLISHWQGFIDTALTGQANLHMELTVAEVLGHANVTSEDMKEACALSSTRYVDSRARNRLLMVPIFDMANHKHECENFLSSYAEENVLHFVSAYNYKAGDEICYSYGSMRDDYAFVHYGFLPDVLSPPRLLLVDHHEFNPQAHHQEYTQDVFEANTADEYAAELQRLQGIQSHLKQLDADAAANKTRPAKGSDPLADVLLDLQARRRTALAQEIKRIQDKIISLAKSDL